MVSGATTPHASPELAAETRGSDGALVYVCACLCACLCVCVGVVLVLVLEVIMGAFSLETPALNAVCSPSRRHCLLQEFEACEPWDDDSVKRLEIAK
jgi:hypothetical protein